MSPPGLLVTHELCWIMNVLNLERIYVRMHAVQSQSQMFAFACLQLQHKLHRAL